MKAILLIDFGSTFTKVTAVDLETEVVLGTAKAVTSIQTDINDGLQAAVASLRNKIGPVDFKEQWACSSAAGGLKMVAVGLVPDLTAEAAKQAALSAGAKVLKVYSYEISSAEASEIQELQPDIILLSGGTDGGNKAVIIHNARVIAGISVDIPVVVAGNKVVAAEVARILSDSGKEVYLCENVMPEFNVLNIEPARTTLRNIFLARIVRAKGITKVQKLIKGIILPTPAAVLNAACLLAKGFGAEKGIGELGVVDVGGATTDIYSLATGQPRDCQVSVKGLVEPFAKRTVEGDLGVRYSAAALVEAAGLDEVAVSSGQNQAEVNAYLDQLSKDPSLLTASELDYGLARLAVRLAFRRHAGRLQQCYTPLGPAYIQTGKDLTGLGTIVGTGGSIIYSTNPLGILRESLRHMREPSLLPQKPRFFLDQKYLLAAMGLLGQRYPELAIRLMKREIFALEGEGF